MKVVHISVALLSVFCAFQIYNVVGQVDLNPFPDLLPTVTNQQCSTFFLSPLFADICNILWQNSPNTTIAGHSLSICDSHCRCTHGAKWGKCLTLNSENVYPYPALGAVTDQYCKCYYSDPPPDTPINNNLLDNAADSPFSLFNSSYCIAWELTPFSMRILPVCNLTSNNATSGICNTDCACTHGYKYGRCDTYCSCYYDGGTQLKNGV